MSTIERPRAEPSTIPPLVAGQRLDRATLHERYEAMPPGVRAELIGGVIYMASSVRYHHGREHGLAVAWSFHYERSTPGSRLWIMPRRCWTTSVSPSPTCPCGSSRRPGGGRPSRAVSWPGRRNWSWRSRSPAASWTSAPRRRMTSGPGCSNIRSLALEPDEVYWHVLRDGRYQAVPPGPDGLYRSGGVPRPLAGPGGLVRPGLPEGGDRGAGAGIGDGGACGVRGEAGRGRPATLNRGGVPDAGARPRGIHRAGVLLPRLPRAGPGRHARAGRPGAGRRGAALDDPAADGRPFLLSEIKVAGLMGPAMARLGALLHAVPDARRRPGRAGRRAGSRWTRPC